MRLAAYDIPRLTALHAAAEAEHVPALRALAAVTPNLGTLASAGRSSTR